METTPSPISTPVIVNQGAFTGSEPTSPSQTGEINSSHDAVVSLRSLTHAKRSVYGVVMLQTHIIPLRPSSAGCSKAEITTQLELRPSAWLLSSALKYGLQADVHASYKGLITSRGVSTEPFLLRGYGALLFQNACKGNVEGMQIVLERGEGSVQDHGLNGWTALHVSGYFFSFLFPFLSFFFPGLHND
jgi:hypothetical protein